MIKVVIIDDEEIIREGLRKIIDWNSRIVKLSVKLKTARDLELINSLQPRILLLPILGCLPKRS
jgi:YesN/AraC family two-component response regulator